MSLDLIKPMLAQTSTGTGNRRAVRLTDLVGKDYIGQEKVDGIRAILYSEGGVTRLFNRSLVEITHRFPEIAKVRLPDVVIDGEVVALDGHFTTVGTRDKQTKAFAAAAKANPCRFVAFDLLRSGGESLTGVPLHTRLTLLRGVVGRRRIVSVVRTSDDLLGLWQDVIAAEGEGIIAKQRRSIYLPGERANSWIKFKALHRLTPFT